MGTNFQNAYLGHMGSETVVSHNVMTSGLLPKHMGWADEWYRDTENVLGARQGRGLRHRIVARRQDRRPDQPRRVLEDPGLPAREVPGQDRRGDRPEELRDEHHGRSDGRHPDHDVGSQLRL